MLRESACELFGRRYVCCGECYVVSNEPTSFPIGAHCYEVMYFGGCFGFGGKLDILNCDYICMCVVNKQFDLVFYSVYVDLQYDEISLTFTAGSVRLCGVCSPVVVIGRSVRLSWYLML